jgi:hypothetical protein
MAPARREAVMERQGPREKTSGGREKDDSEKRYVPRKERRQWKERGPTRRKTVAKEGKKICAHTHTHIRTHTRVHTHTQTHFEGKADPALAGVLEERRRW